MPMILHYIVACMHLLLYTPHVYALRLRFVTAQHFKMCFSNRKRSLLLCSGQATNIQAHTHSLNSLDFST